MEPGKFVYIMSSIGIGIVGKLVSVEFSQGGKENYFVDEAIGCSQVRVPTDRQGVFALNYEIAPINCLDPSPVDLMISDVALMFEVKENSPLAKRYADTIQGWSVQRSGLTLAMPGDEKKVAGLINLKKH